MSGALKLQAANDSEVGATLSGTESEAAHPRQARLVEAIAARDLQALPNRRDEAWRWTDLRGAIRVLPAPSAFLAEALKASPLADAGATREVRVLNGRAETDGITLADGETLALRFVSAGDGAHGVTLRMEVPAGAAATLIETYEGEGAYLAAAELAFDLGEAASLERVVVLADDPRAVSASNAEVRMGARARFAQTVATGGSRLQRHETRLVHPGEGAEVRMDGVYVLHGRHADLTTVVEHRGRDGLTTQAIKGVAGGRARAVFQGRIVVAEGADGTDARLRHDALLLEEGAEIDAKPELEIYADDVQCAHGNTVGALDEEQLFYIRARGISADEARTLLVRAFLGEVVERMEHEGARTAMADWVEAQLGGVAGA